MYTAYALTLAAAKMFFRNKQALFFTLFMPFLIMLIFGYIGFDKPPHVDVGLVVASSTTPGTEQLVAQVRELPTFTIHEGSLGDELTQLKDGNRAVVLEVPANVLGGAPGATTSPIIAHINEGKQAEAGAVLGLLDQLAARGALAVLRAPPLFAIEPRAEGSHNLRYIEFLLPGLIALSIMQMAVFSVGFVFTQYKEKGILKRLLATPMQPWQFVSANIIVRLVVAVIQTAIFIGMGVALFNTTIIGSSFLVALCIVLGALMFLGLGFTISGLATTVDSVPVLANIIVFPMLFLGGTFFPLTSMPEWLRAIAQFLPLTYFSTALRDVMTTAAGFWEIAPDLIGMVVWAVILIGLATVTFSFQEKRSA